MWVCAARLWTRKQTLHVLLAALAPEPQAHTNMSADMFQPILGGDNN